MILGTPDTRHRSKNRMVSCLENDAGEKKIKNPGFRGFFDGKEASIHALRMLWVLRRAGGGGGVLLREMTELVALLHSASEFFLKNTGFSRISSEIP